VYVQIRSRLTLSHQLGSLKLKILIVDDHETLRKGVCAILTSHFLPDICDGAANGQEAIAKALALQPDLNLLDVNMPVMGGFAAARELQKLLPQVPILFLTMHAGLFCQMREGLVFKAS
jgi:two-component system, NarL family, response regulator NreC